MKNKENTLNKGLNHTYGIGEMVYHFPELGTIPWDKRYYSEEEFYQMVTNYTSVTPQEIDRWLNKGWGFGWTVNVRE